MAFDINKMALTDCELYNSQYTFFALLKRYNITMVSQLLDEKVVEELKLHCRKDTRNELLGFIELIKYKYLGIPMTSNQRLKEPYPGGLFYFTIFGFSKEDCRLLDYYIRHKQLDMRGRPTIELFRALNSLEDLPNKRMKEILRNHIEYYDFVELALASKEENLDGEDNQIASLQAQLNLLLTMRQKLNSQIADVQEKIRISTKQKKKVIQAHETGTN